MLPNKDWLYCPFLLIKYCLPPCKTISFVAFTNSEKKACDLRDVWQKMSCIAYCVLNSVCYEYTVYSV